MSFEWAPFTDLLSAIIDNRGRTCPVGEAGIPLIATNCVDRSNLYPSYETTRYVSDETYRTWFRGHPKPGDILFVCKGSPGRTNWVPDPVDFCIAQDMVAVRADPERIYPKYLFAALRSPVVQSQIDNLHVGTLIPHFKKGDFGKLNIPILLRCDQEFIGDLYFVLSERITLLSETNTLLEQIAQTLFKSWFVDFDPVRAKQEGRIPEGMDEDTAALFPDSFEESELGLVPRGWLVLPLAEVFDFKEGPGIRNWQYTNSEEGTRFINIRCIQGGDLSLATANRITNEEANGKYAHFHLQPWDVVVSTSGTLGRSAIVRDEHLPLILNTSVIRFRPNPGSMRFSFVQQYLNSDQFLLTLEAMASGSVQKNFGPMHLKQMKLVCPPVKLLINFDQIAHPLFEKILSNRSQVDLITDLRDTLLPRLISGKLRLLEAEAMLAENALTPEPMN